jgi:ankyrin repeat protein
MNLPSLISPASSNYRQSPVPTGSQLKSNTIAHHPDKPADKPDSFKPRFSGSQSILDVVKQNDPKKLKKALEGKVDINEKYQEPSLLATFFGREKYNEMNALHVLAGQPSPKPECIRLLLEHGIDINAREKDTQWTALHRHMYNWTPKGDTTKTLLENKIDVNATDSHGETALHVLTDRLWTEPKLPIVKLLHAYGADMNPKSNLGRTPLQLMARRHDPNLEVAQYIIQTGHTKSDRAAMKNEFLESYYKHNISTDRAHRNVDRTLQKIEDFSIDELEKSDRPDFKRQAFKTKFHPLETPATVEAKATAPVAEKSTEQAGVKSKAKPVSAWRNFINSIKAVFSAFLNLFRRKKQET